MNDLSGKVALIFGASSGIGKGIATAIAGENPRGIVLAARRIDKLEELARVLGSSKGLEVLPISTDVTIPEQIDSAFQKAMKKFGRIDYVIHSAGLIQGSGDNAEPLESMSDERIKAITDTNYTSVVYIGKRVIPIFKKQKS